MRRKLTWRGCRVAAYPPRHSGGRARHRLPAGGREGQADGASAADTPAARSGGDDNEGAELPAGQSAAERPPCPPSPGCMRTGAPRRQWTVRACVRARVLAC